MRLVKMIYHWPWLSDRGYFGSKHVWTWRYMYSSFFNTKAYNLLKHSIVSPLLSVFPDWRCYRIMTTFTSCCNTMKMEQSICRRNSGILYHKWLVFFFTLQTRLKCGKCHKRINCSPLPMKYRVIASLSKNLWS
jgi:hypothetical protein